MSLPACPIFILNPGHLLRALARARMRDGASWTCALAEYNRSCVNLKSPFCYLS